MKTQEAKEIVNQAINVAIQKGCFNLQEAQAIIHALETINNAPDVELGNVEPVEMQVEK